MPPRQLASTNAPRTRQTSPPPPGPPLRTSGAKPSRPALHESARPHRKQCLLGAWCGFRSSTGAPLWLCGALASACAEPGSAYDETRPEPDYPKPTSSAEPVNPSGGVTFSIPSGTFQDTLTVELEATPGAEIRYTTNGNRASLASRIYDEPLAFDETVQLRAQAYVDGAPSGEPSTAIYVRRTFDASSNLSLLVLDAYGMGKPEDRSRFHDVGLMLFEPNGDEARLSGVPSTVSRAGFRVRGQSSADFDKTPYRIELWDEQDEDLDRALAGLAAESDYALIGPFVDRSLIRNALVYDLGRDMGLAAPHYAWVEVYIQLEDEALAPESYQGLYMLTETIKNARNRLDLSQLRLADRDPAELSGGYILKFDWAAVDESAATLDCTGDEPIAGVGFGPSATGAGSCWFDLEVVDPEPINDVQRAWLQDYVQRLHDRLHEDPLGDYEALIDVDSFADHFLLNELSRDMDAYARSTLFYKDRDQKLKAGPLWDYNLTFAAGGFFGNTSSTGWQFEQRIGSNDWYQRLATDARFMRLAAKRWRHWRQGLLSNQALEQRIADLTIPLVRAAARDFERWPVASTTESLFRIPPGTSWEAQLQAIRDWIPRRLQWLDAAFDQVADD